MAWNTDRGEGSRSSTVVDRELRDRLIGTMTRIRAFELKLLELFSEGKLFGTTHTCVGQEACAAALYANLDPSRDAIFTNHRCHGHYLAWGGDMSSLLAEIMGKTGALVGGRGGSQHLCDGRFFSQGVQGGSMPIACGYALHTKRMGGSGLVVAHIGDGTLGQGVVYETANLAALLQVPLLVVLEHNEVAQSTDTSTTTAGDVLARFEAFGIRSDRRTARDPVALASHLAEVVDYVRSGHPFVQVLDTTRLMAHSKGDDDRAPELLKRAWAEDWLTTLLEDGSNEVLAAQESAEEEVGRLVEEMEDAGWAALGRTDPYDQPAEPLFSSSRALLASEASGAGERRINALLNEALDTCLAEDAECLFLGEDLLDPYGGAFKVAAGLSTKHGERVVSTPISEAAIVGIGNGWSLAGGKAIVEIMFGDFVTLAADQLINQAAKIFHMYGGKARIPMTVRLPSGGYRGYGPTHSQSLEARFCGVPGLKVVALSRRHHPGVLLETTIRKDPNPVLFVENKLLYALRPHTGAPAGFRFVPSTPAHSSDYPALHFTTTEPEEAADVTVVTYGGMTDIVEEAMEHLILEEELDFDYIILTSLSPLELDDVLSSTGRTGRLVTVEEGPESFGMGSEVISRVVAALGDGRPRAARVGALDVPIPNSRVQEREVLPDTSTIIDAIRGLL